MSDCVWFSQLEVSGGELFRDYESVDPEGKSASERIAANLNWQGDLVPPAYIPSAIGPVKAKAGKLLEVTTIRNKFLVVGAQLAAILRDHDLGAGALHPLTVQDANGKVDSTDAFFFWNIGNKLGHFLPEQSTGIEVAHDPGKPPEEQPYSPEILPKDDALAFSRDCLAGPDAWREKYLLKGTVFSDRLMQALGAAKLDKYFEPIRCRVQARGFVREDAARAPKKGTAAIEGSLQ